MTLENIIQKGKKVGLALGASLVLLLADNCQKNQIYAQSRQEENYIPVKQELRISEVPLWRIFEGDGIIADLTVSDNGKNFVFEYRQKEKSDIYFLEQGKEDVLNLTYQLGRGFHREPDCNYWGNKIVFSSKIGDSKEEIYLADLERKILYNVSNNEEADFQPTIDSEGEKIAFTSERDKKSEIYLVYLEDSEPKTLINFSNDQRSWDYQSNISGNGEKIIFVKENERQSLCLKDIKSEKEEILEEHGNKWYANPKLSYDGTRVVWSTSKGAATTKKKIFLKDVLTGDKIKKLSGFGNSERPSIDDKGRFISWLNSKFSLTSNERVYEILIADTKAGKTKEVERYYLGERVGSEFYLYRKGIKTTNYFFKIAPSGEFIGIITERDGNIVYSVDNPHLRKAVPLMKK